MKSNIVIKILDSVHCQIVNKRDIQLLRPYFKYEVVYYRKAHFQRKRKVYFKHLIGTNGLFLTGFKQRVNKIGGQLNIPIEWIDNNGPVVKHDQFNPELPGITFRQDQYDLIQAAVSEQRGVLQSPTGSGKTIVALGIMSCYPKSKILFLCHTVTLITQTMEELKRFGFKDIGVIGDSEKHWGRITVATVQSLARLSSDEYADVDIIIHDEAHHCSSFSCGSAKILGRSLAPIKIGFTATMPYLDEAKLALEGFIGPKIGEITVKELVDIGKLAKPKIKLVPVPYNSILGLETRYKDIYTKAIVQNKARNRLITKQTQDRITNGNTVLIIVKDIAHGDELIGLFEKIYGNTSVVFIQGSTEGQQREMVRKAFTEKRIKCVIATAIWKEGVNIPSLDCVIVAAGGKSEIATLQAIGRGLRTTDDKKEVEIIDFLDRYKYLASHCVERLSFYVEQGWL